MRKSNQLSSQLGELVGAIEMEIFRYLRAHESLQNELFSIGGEQVSVYHGEISNGVRGIIVVGRNPGVYEGKRPFKMIDINRQLDILEQIEDILHID